MRMQEIAEVLASRIAEHDQDFAREVLIDELDMEDEELDYFHSSMEVLASSSSSSSKIDDETPYCGNDILLDWDL